VVNFHFPGLKVLTWIVMKRLRLWRGLIVLSVHGRDVRDAMRVSRPLRRRLMRLIFEQADAIVACSSELSADVATFAPRAKSRTTVIPNGVNANLLRAQPRRQVQLIEPLSVRRFILNVATFEHKKSQDVLIEAFAKLAPAYADVDLVLVGRSTPWLKALRSQADASGVASRVHFLCDLPHTDIPGLLSRASLFCLPSRAEGHPLAILEAAVFALPVVATPVGGVCETITNERDGLLVPVGDVVTLSDAISRLLSDRVLGETLGRRLQRRVETEFTWERAARLYTELVKNHRVIHERRPRGSTLIAHL
jgi:glycosyltransferase involved in cell wall biosynthesis